MFYSAVSSCGLELRSPVQQMLCERRNTGVGLTIFVFEYDCGDLCTGV